METLITSICAVAFVGMLLVVWVCFKMASRCSREEEKSAGKA